MREKLCTRTKVSELIHIMHDFNKEISIHGYVDITYHVAKSINVCDPKICIFLGGNIACISTVSGGCISMNFNVNCHPSYFRIYLFLHTSPDTDIKSWS